MNTREQKLMQRFHATILLHRYLIFLRRLNMGKFIHPIFSLFGTKSINSLFREQYHIWHNIVPQPIYNLSGKYRNRNMTNFFENSHSHGINFNSKNLSTHIIWLKLYSSKNNSLRYRGKKANGNLTPKFSFFIKSSTRFMVYSCLSLRRKLTLSSLRNKYR